jgi:hypothetical protein
MARPPRTLIEIGTMNLLAASGDRGVRAQIRAARKAGQAVEVFYTLALASLQGAGADGWPNQREYSEFAGITTRQAVRHWQLVAEVFPGEDGPDRVAKLMAVDMKPLLEERGFGAAAAARGDKLSMA